jgi:hypothetical protein
MFDGKVEAIVYRHSDCYPSGAGVDLKDFLKIVKKEVKDNRFNDPNYLAAKYVVYLADMFNHSYQFTTDGKDMEKVRKPSKYDFLSVGVVMEDPGDIEYRYEVECSKLVKGYPKVTCWQLGDVLKKVAIPNKRK